MNVHSSAAGVPNSDLGQALQLPSVQRILSLLVEIEHMTMKEARFLALPPPSPLCPDTPETRAFATLKANFTAYAASADPRDEDEPPPTDAELDNGAACDIDHLSKELWRSGRIVVGALKVLTEATRVGDEAEACAADATFADMERSIQNMRRLLSEQIKNRSAL